METDSISVSGGEKLIENGDHAMNSTINNICEAGASKDLVDEVQVEASPVPSIIDEGKRPTVPFHRLPEVVIKRILYLVDANVFASLVLLNREWRRISSSAHLYHHHLADYHVSGSSELSDTPTQANLDALKRKFAIVTRRNTFEVFLRPKKTVVKLISTSASSSSAFPQGEALRFTFSAYGRQLLSISSSRIFVIDLTLDPISVLHELKILRRPIVAAILDDGNLLAVASSKHQIHIYKLGDRQARLTQTIELNGIPRALAFSPKVAVLAVAYDESIEVYALGEDVLSTARRAVRCFDIGSLSFCRDGSTLLGSSNDLRVPSLVTISPPLLTDPTCDLSLQDLHSRMWTTQILFPDVNERYTHVELVPSTKDSDGAVCFVGYDSELKAFRIEPIDNIGAGTLFFTGPGTNAERDEPGPCTMPVVSEEGEFLAVSYEESGIWIYGIPATSAEVLTPTAREKLQEPPDTVRPAHGNVRSKPESTNSQRLRKTINGLKSLIPGYPLSALGDISALRWVHNSDENPHGCKNLCRLVAVAPGGVDSVLDSFSGERIPIDSGRIVIFDFRRAATDGENAEVTIELGDEAATELPEHGASLDVEVELERRRTHVNRHRGLGAGRPATMRHGTQVRRDRGLGSTTMSVQNGQPHPNSLPFIDSPYSNNSPRSIDTLQRAATAGAQNATASRYRNFRTPLSNRRRSTQFVVPHESDADNWVPPPPPYTADDEAPPPEHLRRALFPSSIGLPSNSPSNSLHPRCSQNSGDEPMTEPRLQRSTTNIYPTNQEIIRHSIPNRALPGISDTRNPITTLEASTDNNNLINTSSLSGNGHMYNHATTSDISLHNDRFRYSTQPLHPPSTQDTHDQSTAVIGRNGPSHHLPQNTNSSLPSSEIQSITNSSRMEPSPLATEPRTNQRSSYTSSVPIATPDPISQSSVPDVLMLPVQRQVSETNSLPTALFSSNSSTLNPRENRWLNPSNGATGTTNMGVERSRSRSQDVPRRRPIAGGTGLFDRRTGRKVLASQSDAGIGPNRRSDDLRDQWNRFLGERKNKKESKCAVM